jgi:micrococcal nuclease
MAAPAPVAWPPPGALPAEELERRTSPPVPALGPDATAAATSIPGAHVAPGATATTVQPAATPAPTERVSRRRILTRGPELTLTRIAIILMAALLGFSAISSMARSNSSASHPPSPASGIDASPLTGESPGASNPVPPSSVAQPAFQPSATTQFATVTSVTDGDTIKVDIDGKEFRVRYIGMDAPEPDATDPAIKRIADAATAANSGIVAGKDVYLEREVSDTDQFGRLLRDVWLIDDGGSYVLVNVELVRLGYAQISTFPPDVRYVRELQAAQEKAQQDGVGIWGIGKSIPPATPAAPGAVASPQGAAGANAAADCHPSYDPCLPIVESLDCAQVRAMGKAPVTVKGPDDYMLDPEEDGKGCESNE